MARRIFRSVAATASAFSLLLAPLNAWAEPVGAKVHVVEPGESLSQIADQAGVEVDALAKLNSLDNVDFLVVGQSLKLPANAAAAAASPPSAAVRSTPSAAPAPSGAPASSVSATTAASAGSAASSATASAGAPRSVTVADGDTLWSIAQQFSTTTAAIVAANNLDDPDHVGIGMQLVLPASASAGAALAQPVASSASAPSGPSGTTTSSSAGAAAPRSPAPGAAKRSLLVPYTVQPGETLNQIARQFDVRADAIAQASALEDPNRLSVGAVLKVPLPGHEHQVKEGETLRDIAAQEKVDLGSLIDFNDLADPELIRIGQVLMVPTPPTLQAATANPAATDAAAATSKPAAPTAPAPAPAAAANDAAAAAPAAAPAAPNAAPAAAPAVPAPNTAPPAAAPRSALNAAATTPRAAAATGAGQPAKPAAPAVVPAPPRGSPTDGLAGAGLKLLGAPYVWGGSSPSGFDCSGFVWYVARQAGKSLSRGMLGEYNSGAHPARDELKPGDLVFFQNTYSAGLSHNGIYIGNNQFVHAADETAGVTISSLGAAYWSSHWFGATRLP